MGDAFDESTAADDRERIARTLKPRWLLVTISTSAPWASSSGHLTNGRGLRAADPGGLRLKSKRNLWAGATAE